jgi:glycosyltransferase involved in cell wall biosynthesis
VNTSFLRARGFSDVERQRTLVSIAIPIYNERTVLPELVERLAQNADGAGARYAWEFILVDDGSRDGSLTVARGLIAKEPRLRVIELRRNYGQTAALQAGLDESRGDIIITMDGDLQHFPEDIPRFLERIEAGGDLVCGWRRKRREGIVRRWPSRAANWMIRRISGLSIHDIGTTFRAYRREIVEDITLLGENHRFVPVFASRAGARIEEVEIENIERPKGASNYGLGRVIGVWLDLFFLLFYVRYFDRPIRAFGGLAFLLFLAAMAIVAVLGVMSIAYGTPVVYQRAGWVYLTALLFVTGTQLLMTGIVAEVLARVYFSRNVQRQHSPYTIRRRHTEPPRDVP